MLNFLWKKSDFEQMSQVISHTLSPSNASSISSKDDILSSTDMHLLCKKIDLLVSQNRPDQVTGNLLRLLRMHTLATNACLLQLKNDTLKIALNSSTSPTEATKKLLPSSFIIHLLKKSDLKESSPAIISNKASTEGFPETYLITELFKGGHQTFYLLLLNKANGEDFTERDRSILLILKPHVTLSYKQGEIASELKKTKDTHSQELQKSQNILREKERMVSLITHDLKNPLNTVIGLTELNFKQENLERINHAGKRMLHLVTDLLETFKMADPQVKAIPKSIDLDILIDYMLESVNDILTRERINLHISMPSKAIINIDINLITRVFINLITNVIEHNPTTKHIEINIQFESSSYLVCTLSDFGKPIPSEHWLHIFQPYYQVNPGTSSQPTTGIGLTFCKLALDAHGSSIKLTSNSETGNAFQFCLPLIQSAQRLDCKTVHRTVSQKSEQAFLLSDIQYLTPIARSILKYDICEWSEIKRILDQPSPPSKKISEWKKAVKNSLLNSDRHLLFSLTQAVLSNHEN